MRRAQARVVGLFRLTFRDACRRARQGQRRAGLSDPGDDADKLMRLKPQNLVTGLPIKHLEAVS